nr:MAG: replication associated protein [Cressdnaviricota sp.]
MTTVCADVPTVSMGKRNSKKPIHPGLHWRFTLNHPSEADIDLWRNVSVDVLKKMGVSKFVVSLEKGEKSGIVHLQGAVQFMIRIRTPTDHVVSDSCYMWFKSDCPKKNFEYCLKPETHVDGPWCYGVVLNKDDKTKVDLSGPPSFLLSSLRPWQEEIMKLVSVKADDRKVIWVVDPTGGNGKTALCKHICSLMKDNALYVCGKGADVKFGVYEFVKKAKKRLDVCLFNFTRDAENFVSYSSIEQIKDGIFYNTKYESGMCMFASPHIVCFSNFEPDLNKLSADRWHVIKLSDPRVLNQGSGSDVILPGDLDPPSASRAAGAPVTLCPTESCEHIAGGLASNYVNKMDNIGECDLLELLDMI